MNKLEIRTHGRYVTSSTCAWRHVEYNQDEVVFPKYAEMRDSDAEGSINFLLLKCPISRLAIWRSHQLEVLTLETGAAAAASALVPCISLSLGLLTSPPSA